MELIIHFTALPEKLSLDMVKSDLAELLAIPHQGTSIRFCHNGTPFLKNCSVQNCSDP